MQLLSSLRWLHIAAGMTALSVLWLPLFAKKGSRLHVRAGLVYAWAMGIVALTGGPLALAMLADDKPANDLSALFLAYVGVLAGANSWIGVRALRTKGQPLERRRMLDLALPVVLGLSAIAIGAVGLVAGRTLNVVFALLGLLLAIGHLRFWLKPPVSRADSLLMHIGAMGGSCIATITAFLVVNSHHLGLGGSSLVVWITPGAVGGALIALTQKRTRKEFANAAESGHVRAPWQSHDRSTG